MIAVLCPCFVLSVLIWGALNWAWFKPRRIDIRLKELGFGGNPYKLLFGDSREVSKCIREAQSKPISFSDDILPRALPHLIGALKYGKKSCVWIGPKPVLVIMDPELVKEVTHKIQVFQKTHSNPYAKMVAQGVLTYDGNKWAKQRRLLNPAFHTEKVKHMLPAFYESTSEMLGNWEQNLGPKGSTELDVWPIFQALTSNTISRTAFGSDYKRGRRIVELQSEQLEHYVNIRQSLYIPGQRFLPTKRNKRMKQIEKEVDGLIRGIIYSRQKATREGAVGGDDLLGLLLDANYEEMDKHGIKKFGMTIEEVIQECKLFYLAGAETTSSLLVWTMILLSRYPEWQARAREEVLQCFGTKKPDFDGLNCLKILNMVLHEVLRMYAPVPIINRRTTQEIKIGDSVIPNGMQIMIPIMILHHDEEVWGADVKEFKPERFAEGVAHATKGRAAFFPFGYGPRICIGQNFGLLQSKLAMVMILQSFSFELSPSYCHAPLSVMSLKPQYGAHLILHKL